MLLLWTNSPLTEASMRPPEFTGGNLHVQRRLHLHGGTALQ